mgnify:CR=1 FL=1
MILFNRYEQNKGKYHISPTLLWEYDLRHFDWQQARSIVVQRVIERGCAEDSRHSTCTGALRASARFSVRFPHSRTKT